MATLRKRSVRVSGHPTSVSLEDAFWEALKEIASARGLALDALVAEVDAGRDARTTGEPVGLSAALRLYALAWYRTRRE